MKHVWQYIIEIFKRHDDTAIFVKWAGIGGFGSGVFLFGSTLHVSDLVFTLIIKCCYTGSVAILTGMIGVVGKKIGQWLIKNLTKLFSQKKNKYPFSKNGKQDRA